MLLRERRFLPLNQGFGLEKTDTNSKRGVASGLSLSKSHEIHKIQESSPENMPTPTKFNSSQHPVILRKKLDHLPEFRSDFFDASPEQKLETFQESYFSNSQSKKSGVIDPDFMLVQRYQGLEESSSHLSHTVENGPVPNFENTLNLTNYGRSQAKRNLEIGPVNPKVLRSQVMGAWFFDGCVSVCCGFLAILFRIAYFDSRTIFGSWLRDFHHSLVARSSHVSPFKTIVWFQWSDLLLVILLISIVKLLWILVFASTPGRSLLGIRLTSSHKINSGFSQRLGLILSELLTIAGFVSILLSIFSPSQLPLIPWQKLENRGKPSH